LEIIHKDVNGAMRWRRLKREFPARTIDPDQYMSALRTCSNLTFLEITFISKHYNILSRTAGFQK
jgi:hypothetical protein